MILQEFNINNKEMKFLFLIIELSISTIFFILIPTLLICLNLIITIIIKCTYIVIGISYYIYKIVLFVYYFFADTDDTDWVDILFFLIALSTIAPRIIFIRNIDEFIAKIKLIIDCKDGKDHDKLLEKVENKIDRGDTEWSKGPKSERKTNRFTNMNNNNSEKKVNYPDICEYTIKEDYIEENKEDNSGEENLNNNEEEH